MHSYIDFANIKLYNNYIDHANVQYIYNNDIYRMCRETLSINLIILLSTMRYI